MSNIERIVTTKTESSEITEVWEMKNGKLVPIRKTQLPTQTSPRQVVAMNLRNLCTSIFSLDDIQIRIASVNQHLSANANLKPECLIAMTNQLNKINKAILKLAELSAIKEEAQLQFLNEIGTSHVFQEPQESFVNLEMSQVINEVETAGTPL